MHQITKVKSFRATLVKTLFAFGSGFPYVDGSCSFKTIFSSVVQRSGFIITCTQGHKSDEAVSIGSKALGQLEYNRTICFPSPSQMQIVKKWEHLETWLLWMIFSFTTALAWKDKNNVKEAEKCYNSKRFRW